MLTLRRLYRLLFTRTILPLAAGLLLAWYWWGMVVPVFGGSGRDFMIFIGFPLVLFFGNRYGIWPVMLKQKNRVQAVTLVLAGELLVLSVLVVVISIRLSGMQLDLSADGWHEFEVANLSPVMLPKLAALLLSLQLAADSDNRDRDTARQLAEQGRAWERQLADAKIAWRRAQMNPHLMSHQLVAIRVLTVENIDVALEAMDLLNRITRFYTGSNTADGLISLADELEQVRNLAAFLAIRHGGDLCLDMHLPAVVPPVGVIPMTVLELLENMSCHGVVTDKHRPAVLRVGMSERQLQVYAANAVSPHTHAVGTGTGLANLAEQVRYYFPDSPGVQYRMLDGVFEATVILNLPGNEVNRYAP